MTDVTVDAARVAELREVLIRELWDWDALRSSAVEQAFRAVPRHLFLPEVSPEQAYAAQHATVTKRDEHGGALSSVSAARIQAFMLEQADIHPGMRVLEIGSGGLNAALIAELVGHDGQITSLDIDPDVIDRARRLLSAAGYEQVRTICADGTQGAPEHAPYDRIVITVEAAELAQAWIDQLADDGSLVVPLRVRGVTRSVVFGREDGYWRSRDYAMCGFVPLQGVNARSQQRVAVHDGDDGAVSLRVDGPDPLDTASLRQALFGPHIPVWSGVINGPSTPFDELLLWLAGHLPGHAHLISTPQTRDSELLAPHILLNTSALLSDDGTSFAAFATRPTSPERTWFEFGAIGHGPHARSVAEHMIAEIQTWDRDHRQQRAEFRAYPAETPSEQLPTDVVSDGESFRITLSWPPPGT